MDPKQLRSHMEQVWHAGKQSLGLEPGTPDEALLQEYRQMVPSNEKAIQPPFVANAPQPIAAPNDQEQLAAMKLEAFGAPVTPATVQQVAAPETVPQQPWILDKVKSLINRKP